MQPAARLSYACLRHATQIPPTVVAAHIRDLPVSFRSWPLCGTNWAECGGSQSQDVLETEVGWVGECPFVRAVLAPNHWSYPNSLYICNVEFSDVYKIQCSFILPRSQQLYRIERPHQGHA